MLSIFFILVHVGSWPKYVYVRPFSLTFHLLVQFLKVIGHEVPRSCWAKYLKVNHVESIIENAMSLYLTIRLMDEKDIFLIIEPV